MRAFHPTRPLLAGGTVPVCVASDKGLSRAVLFSVSGISLDKWYEVFMHRWGRFFFSLLLMGGALWITVPAVKQWWIYYELKQSVPAELLSGAVVPQGEELWGWEITYAYEIEGTRFLRTELCRAPLFRHPEIAKKRLLEKAFSLRAYYSPSTPKRATLECYFPLKELIYSGLAWAIWLYMILFLYHAWPDRCLDRRTERRTWP